LYKQVSALVEATFDRSRCSRSARRPVGAPPGFTCAVPPFRFSTLAPITRLWEVPQVDGGTQSVSAGVPNRCTGRPKSQPALELLL